MVARKRPTASRSLRASTRLKPSTCFSKSAANTLLDRAYGKAPTFSTSDTQVFKRAIDMSDDELAAIVAGAKLTLVKRGEIAPTVNGTPRTRGTPMRMRLEKWFESHSPIGLVER